MTFVVDCNSKYKMCQCTGNKIKVWIRVKSVRPDTNTDIYVIKLKAHPSQFKLLSYSAHCYSLHYWGLKAVWKSHSYMLCYMYSGELEQVCAGVFTYVHLTLCACVCVFAFVFQEERVVPDRAESSQPISQSCCDIDLSACRRWGGGKARVGAEGSKERIWVGGVREFKKGEKSTL